MPLIRIENWPREDDGTTVPRSTTLIERLRTACVQANVPGITDAKHVTVVLGGHQRSIDDQTMVIIVEGLFDRPERTKEIRDRLATMLAEAAHANFKGSWIQNWKIEVLVMPPFNLDVGSYSVVEPKPA